MKLTREHFRAITFHNFQRGLSRQQCIDQLNSLYGDKAPSSSTVKKWYKEFDCDRRSLQDELDGCPKSVMQESESSAPQPESESEPPVPHLEPKRELPSPPPEPELEAS